MIFKKNIYFDMYNKPVYRTTPATPGLWKLNRDQSKKGLGTIHN